MSVVKWYLFLRKKGYPRFYSILYSFYNSKYWEPYGEWPYGIKKKHLDKHRAV